MYHQVADAPEAASSVVVSVDSFQRQMEFLKTHRYRVLGLSDLVRELQTGKVIPAKTVSITFDDGNLDNFKNAFPILKKMGFPATIFMITDNVGKPGFLAEEDLRILDDSAVSIGSHTVHHAFLPDLEPERVREELTESKKALEKILGPGHEVTLFSYPGGGMTPEIQAAVREAGYKAAATTNYRTKKNDTYGLHRIKISESSSNLFNFWLKLSGYYHLGKKRVLANPGR